MATKLHKTTADYLVIAVSPALIMAMVGSLVYFLVEVFYGGDYEARVDYAFGLFVFAAVLIARISIEMGSQTAALYALPLGGAMFLVLMKFVQHPSPFSHLINLALMGIVWWCAHKLTWDSTVIDEDEDASGEGLMQRIGVDGPEADEGGEKETAAPAPTGEKENELLEGPATTAGSALRQRLKRLVLGKQGPHTPGIWVFYFSLLALPLFGIGQRFIPAEATGRRRYAFSLLLVYVASALALLVTTSFLNLRRYLRQRRIEMPLPIAGTWVAVGAALIAAVMIAAMLIPRPGAEVALSQVPWQVSSLDGLSASRAAVNRDGGEKQGDQENATGGEKTAEQGQGNQPPNGQPSENKAPGPDGKASTDNGQGKGAPSSANGKDAKSQEGAKNGESSSGSPNQPVKPLDKNSTDNQAAGREGKATTGDKQDKQDSKSAESKDGKQQAEGKSGETSKSGEKNGEKSPDKKEAGKSDAQSGTQQNRPSDSKPSESSGTSSPTFQAVARPMEMVQNVATAIGGPFGLLKIMFYIVAGVFIAIQVWRYRHQIMQAISDILRMLRELFGGRGKADGKADDEMAVAGARPRSFSDFRDPFLTGQHGQIPPEELVRYTFAAFEAWANDRGRPRTPDCTPLELLQVAVEPKTALHTEARKLVRLYGELAYASRRVPRGAADELREVWLLMRNAGTIEVGGAGQR